MFLNRMEAKRHWRAKVDAWKVWADALVEEVRSIPEPALRYAVAGTLDCVASGCGEISVRKHDARHLAMDSFVLDPEAMDLIHEGLLARGTVDPETTLTDAALWIRERLRKTDAIQVAWALGPLRFEGIDLPLFTVDHVVYDLRKRRILGVATDNGIYKV